MCEGWDAEGEGAFADGDVVSVESCRSVLLWAVSS